MQLADLLALGGGILALRIAEQIELGRHVVTFSVEDLVTTLFTTLLHRMQLEFFRHCRTTY